MLRNLNARRANFAARLSNRAIASTARDSRPNVDELQRAMILGNIADWVELPALLSQAATIATKVAIKRSAKRLKNLKEFLVA
ncbi:hypothetical protein [Blastopirellula marina]|uniref:Uncharacterized protein n=1 Tax=Blastopirellula marina TaxID=124 RepID=A0A2S8GGE7_9BACT|nr:hypothetical protein [Blastopirellula marina]PQO43537.1 hypothetical protein C5Y93_23085 [Blastopirellula marina]